jgi:hypothetical protein
MGYLIEDKVNLSSWIKNELRLRKAIEVGTKGLMARRVQEWLNLHGLGLDIDGDFGNITKKKVAEFQEVSGLPRSGGVDDKTYEVLSEPLKRTLIKLPVDDGETLGSLTLKYAQLHLQEHPRETGGQNCGPWVRLYMKGNEGQQWPWCAGFVTFALKQASQALGVSSPVSGSFSCDSFASQGKAASCFVNESELSNGSVDPESLSVASAFLVRRTSSDWTHTGFVTRFDEDSFETIEGNTNDDGDREGYEVCSRTRGYGSKDFILIY